MTENKSKTKKRAKEGKIETKKLTKKKERQQ